ncbi:MAG: CBS domain-containing protein [Desulfurococcales archaeon]|nr:CBS domain-containing protein [Desulfurococcales archaeon]MCE4622441.1 CBS domain-containing protein [Desulfurococcales archaeon]
MPASLFPKTRSSPVSRLLDSSPLTVSPKEPLTRVRALFRSTRARVAYVIDKRTRKLLGRITRSEILAISSAKSNATVEAVMDEPPVILAPEDTIADSVSRMLRVDEWYAPVLENNRLLGHLGLEHVIKSMLEEDPKELEKREVETIMTREVEVANREDFVVSIWDKMRELGYTGLPVVDDKGRLVGIVTQSDLLSEGVKLALESSGGPNRGPRVREVMTTTVVYLYPWSKILEAAEIMVNKGIGRIPVVDSELDKRIVGIVDREDIVRLIV